MIRALIACTILLASFGAACAQTAPALLLADPLSAPRTAAAPPANALLDRTPVLVEVPGGSTEERFRISADLGLPTGVRVGVRIAESRFWAEFGVGVYVIVPYASTALRYDCRLYEGSSDRFAVRPSISATVVPLRNAAVGGGADVEFVWQHRFADRLMTDLGFRIGGTVLQHRSDTFVAPVLTLVLAAQF